MTEPVSSSSSSSSSFQRSSGEMTIDIRPMIEDVSQVMTKHITKILSGVIGEYTVYKETHDTIMGLPCVRKLQERIYELEKGMQSSASGDVHSNGGGSTREDEITQLQSAIVELNRYIVALESKVDMKTVCSSSASASEQQYKHDDEETVRLEVHEEDNDDDTQSQSEVNVHNTFTHSSSSIENTIISSTSDGDFETPADDDGDDNNSGDNETEGLAEDDDVVEVEPTEEEAEEEEDAGDEEQEEETADDEEECVDEEAADDEAEDEVADEEGDDADEAAEEDAADNDEAAEDEGDDAEEADANDEEEEVVAEEEEEAEIEVSEVTIKGKKYFTTDTQNGTIYACVDDDVGDEVGVFKNGVAVFNKGKK